MSNWLQKIAIPIKINDKMLEIARKVVEKINKYKGEKEKEELIHVDILNEVGKRPYYFNFYYTPSGTEWLRGSASTPAWRHYREYSFDGSGSCNIYLYGKQVDSEKLRIILHEMIHCIDPKLNKEQLFKEEWHKKNRGFMHDPNYMSYNHYFKTPWEQDAYMSSDAYHRISNYKRWGIPYFRVLTEIKNATPDSKAENVYYKSPKLWRKYLKMLSYYLNKIYKDDIPKNKAESLKIENEWYQQFDKNTV
jgi:hypothetical protein